MSAQHTPGPWAACGAGKCSCRLIWSKSAVQNVATAKPVACVHGEWGDAPDLIYGEIPAEQVEANARLIAAAPDLLEALRHFSEMETSRAALCHLGLTDEEHCVRCGPILRARAAIAKAEGK